MQKRSWILQIQVFNLMRKKIAFVIGALTSGGAERVICNLANALVNEWDITIITLTKKEPFYPLDSRIKIQSCLNDTTGSTNAFSALLLNIRLLKKIIRILRSEKTALLISFITRANILSLMAARYLSIPCIISERTYPTKVTRTNFDGFFRKLIYPLCKMLIVQTSPIKKYFQKILPEKKITVLANPISPQCFTKKTPDMTKDNIILNVGKLHTIKNQQLLIKAFSKINHHNWKLYIIGEGPKRNELETLIADLNMGSHILLPGMQKNINEFYNMAKIFVLTSQYEGFPNALIEAMHCGLPCIPTDCLTGPAELIKDGENGFLIPVGDQTALEERLLKLMCNKMLREKFSAQATEATKKFELANVIPQWERILKQFTH